MSLSRFFKAFIPGSYSFLGDDEVTIRRPKRPKRELSEAERYERSRMRGEVVASRLRGRFGHSDAIFGGSTFVAGDSPLQGKTLLGQ